MGFEDRAAIITGSGQGIGRAYATALAERGARVAIAEANEERGKAVEAELLGRGHRAKHFGVDVGDESSVRRMVDEVVAEFGRIDILVNNAAIFSTITLKPFEEISVEEWESVMRVNVTGVFLMCRTVVPVMRPRQYGRIVNVSSATVLSGKSHYLHYVTSKAGVAGMTRALAREVGDDFITVNTISPGATQTEVPRQTVTPEQQQRNLQQQCIKRPAQPDDIVGMVIFLCSDEASYITGQFVNVDGGKMLH